MSVCSPGCSSERYSESERSGCSPGCSRPPAVELGDRPLPVPVFELFEDKSERPPEAVQPASPVDLTQGVLSGLCNTAYHCRSGINDRARDPDAPTCFDDRHNAYTFPYAPSVEERTTFEYAFFTRPNASSLNQLSANLRLAGMLLVTVLNVVSIGYNSYDSFIEYQDMEQWDQTILRTVLGGEAIAVLLLLLKFSYSAVQLLSLPAMNPDPAEVNGLNSRDTNHMIWSNLRDHLTAFRVYWSHSLAYYVRRLGDVNGLLLFRLFQTRKVRADFDALKRTCYGGTVTGTVIKLIIYFCYLVGLLVVLMMVIYAKMLPIRGKPPGA